MKHKAKTNGLIDVQNEDVDLELLHQISNQNKSAFETLYHKYHRRLFQFLFRILKETGETEESLNDVMFVVWQQAGSFKAQSKVSTWILGIAYRKALKRRERRKKLEDPVTDEMYAMLEDPDPAANPENWYASAEYSKQINNGINDLSIEHRSVVELTALGYSYKEISDIVECPENTVKTRMFYARRQLKVFLSKTETSNMSNLPI